ncbi:MAG: ABC transporter permease [Nitrososphaeria archaeon]
MKLYVYFIRRLILMVFVLLGVSAIVFYLARGFPHAISPVAQYITEHMTPDQIKKIEQLHGFDQPVYVQYFYWARDVLNGDWGVSKWAASQPTYKVFFDRFPFTVELTVVAVLMTVAIGIPLGIISAIRNNKIEDHVSRLIALTGYSTPSYWIGYMMQLVFFYYFYTWGLPYMPNKGMVDEALLGTIPRVTGIPILDGLLAGNLNYAWSAVVHVLMPAFTLAFISLGYLARLVRASMLEVMRQDYIILARSKGLAERVVVYRHAMKNALIPAVTLTGLLFAGLLGGAMITEQVFTWPGVGRMSLQAVFQGDSNFLLLYSLVLATIIVVTNLVVDILYGFLDPRIKY